MKRLLQEPLLHFLLLGAGLFALSNLVGERIGSDPESIVITRGQVEHLAMNFARVWQRPPSPEELEGLMQDYIREEVYCREAMALRLDKDDTVIRRRLRQKLEFISEDLAAQAEPTDEDLLAYLEAHPEAFATEPRFTFDQVYLSPQRRGKNLGREADQILAQLQQAAPEANFASYSDPFLLAHRFENASAVEIKNMFGEKFAASLSALKTDEWQGPVESGYGVHLVLVSERTEGRIPALEEVREAVRREWMNAQRLEMNRKFYQALLQRYTVIIETPDGEKELREEG